MTTQLTCLLIGMVLPYIWAFSSWPFRSQQFGQIDINLPRHQANQLLAGGARAVGAQANAWEALILFSAANIGAFLAGVDSTGDWALAAIVWRAARVGHGAFYLLGIAPMRVLAFAISAGMSFWIMAMGLMA
jgi:uncharacterized MAPEG superfamily protein